MPIKAVADDLRSHFENVIGNFYQVQTIRPCKV